MSTYYVEVHVYHPYKIEQSFMETCSDYGVAIRRAIEKFKSQRVKGRKVKQVWATARIA